MIRFEPQKQVSKLGDGDHRSLERDSRLRAQAAQRLHLTRHPVANNRKVADGLNQLLQGGRTQAAPRPGIRRTGVFIIKIPVGEVLLLTFFAGDNRKKADRGGDTAPARPRPLGGEGHEVAQALRNPASILESFRGGIDFASGRV